MSHNPANNNCPKNADPRNESCACDPPWTEVGSIVLTPNYGRMFRQMMLEAQIQAKAKELFDNCLMLEEQAGALRAVQRFLAPLNIAAQCMTNREAVEQFREMLNQIVQDIDRTANKLEAEAREEDEEEQS